MVTVPPEIVRPPPFCKTKGEVRELSSNGVMDEGSGKVQKASTHRSSRVGVDLTSGHGNVAAIDPKPSSTLPNRGIQIEMSERFHPTG